MEAQLRCNFRSDMSEINFFSEDTEFVFSNKGKASSWLIAIGEIHKKKLGEINMVFCSDDYLHQLNMEYLKHDTLTDIITFPYDEENQLSGDIFISIDRVKENAMNYGVDEDIELRRVMAHGILHLCGFKDKTAEDQEAMRHQEEEAINLW